MFKEKHSIKVIIADTSFIIRKGIKTLLKENERFQYLSEAYDCKRLEEILKKGLPDVLIIEYNDVASFSFAEIESIKKKHAGLNILVISNFAAADTIRKIINLGITNYLLKDCDEKEVTDAIVACSKGQKYFCKKITNSLLERELSLLTSFVSTPVSEREIEVITFLVTGMRPKEIAQRMKLSYHTVVTHKRNIFSKLKITNSIELAQFAIKAGIIK